VDIVHKLVEPDLKQTSLNTDLYVLSALLSNSLAGRTKFAIYAYLNVKKKKKSFINQERVSKATSIRIK
jgi:hypothetical protein